MPPRPIYTQPKARRVQSSSNGLKFSRAVRGLNRLESPENKNWDVRQQIVLVRYPTTDKVNKKEVLKQFKFIIRNWWSNLKLDL